jgi:CBS domain-containing protein
MNIGSDLRTETVLQAGPIPPVRVQADLPVRAALELLREIGRSAVLVCEGDRLVGIFTERDALRILASEGDLDAPIKGSMAQNLVTVRETDSVETAISKMSTNGYRRLPIVDDQGRPTGLLDVSGVIHWLVDHFPSEVYNLPPVAKPAMHQREGP